MHKKDCFLSRYEMQLLHEDLHFLFSLFVNKCCEGEGNKDNFLFHQDQQSVYEDWRVIKTV